MKDNDEFFSVEEILAEVAAAADGDNSALYGDGDSDVIVDDILGSADKISAPDIIGADAPLDADKSLLNDDFFDPVRKSHFFNEWSANSRDDVPQEDGFEAKIESVGKSAESDAVQTQSKPVKASKEKKPAVQSRAEALKQEKPLAEEAKHYGEAIHGDDYAEDLSDDLDCPHDNADLTNEEISQMLAKRQKSAKSGCVLSGLLAAAAVVIEILNHFKSVTPDIISAAASPTIYCAVNLILLALGAAAAYKPLIYGISCLLRMKANKYSLSALAAAGCIIQGAVFIVFPPDGFGIGNIHLYAPVALVSLAFACFGYKTQADNAVLNLKVVSSKYDKYGVMIMKDSFAAPFTKGVVYDVPVLAFRKETDGVDNFAGRAFSRDAVDSVSRVLAPFVAAAAVILGAAVGFTMNSVGTGLTVFAAIVTVSAPFTYVLGSALTMKKAVKRLVKLGGTIVGSGGTDFYSYTNSIVLNARSLFPQDTVVLHGIKTFGGARIDDAILSAASVACACDSVLRDMFMQIISGKKDMLSHAEGLQYEDGYGVSAWVNKKRVLIGTREHMLNYGVDAPSKDYEEKYADGKNELVYLSVSGELSAVFVVELLADSSVVHALRMLEYKDVAVVIDTSDAIITQEKMEKLFGIDRQSVKILPSRLKSDHEQAQEYIPKIESGIIVNNTAASFAAAVCEAKKLKSSFMLQIILHLASVLAGFLMIAAFAFIRDFSQLTTPMLMVYQAMWAVICIIAAKIK